MAFVIINCICVITVVDINFIIAKLKVSFTVNHCLVLIID